jgi:membrane-bound serine protease (ClpP class)
MMRNLPSLARLAVAVALGAFAALTLISSADADTDSEPRVLVAEIATPITPVVADHIEEGLERAADGGYAAYVIELDTPGGLVVAMRDIVSDILASPVPVIVYVAPDGARAASAGAVITLAAHVAVMAPGTSVGAATPVGMEGEEATDKIINDMAAYTKALAELRDRDREFAEEMVREGRAIDVGEAVEIGAVDGRAESLAGALAVADGLEVTVVGERTVTVATQDAVVERHDMGTFRQVLQFLADPNIAFLLLTIGTLGLIYELASPGIGFAGATGLIALILALFSLSVLPVTAVGVLLLALAAALFLAEVFAPGVAGFGFGGAVVLVLAALFLFDDASGVSVDLWAAVPLAVVMFIAVVVIGRVALRTRRAPSTTTGADLLIGRQLKVREADGRDGTAYAIGSWWSLRSIGPPLQAGAEVLVTGIDGLVLLVDPRARPDEETRKDEESEAP